MTIPSERLRALINARSFLYDLLDPKETPRVPLKIRRQAKACLKHFPRDFDLARMQVGMPELFGDVSAASMISASGRIKDLLKEPSSAERDMDILLEALKLGPIRNTDNI